jgi:hypothetical protein
MSYSKSHGLRLNRALCRELGVKPGDRYSVYIDKENDVVGFVFKPDGFFVSTGQSTNKKFYVRVAGALAAMRKIYAAVSTGPISVHIKPQDGKQFVVIDPRKGKK